MTDSDIDYLEPIGAMTPDGFAYVGYGIMSDDEMECLEWRNGGPPYRNGPHITLTRDADAPPTWFNILFWVGVLMLYTVAFWFVWQWLAT